MWWLAIPVAGLIGRALYSKMAEKKTPPSRSRTTLETNLLRLRSDLRHEAGRKIAIMGQPGAGKSSLLKKMTNGRVVPLPVIGVQTDATNWSSDSACELLSRYGQTVFVDVPGYDTLSHPLDAFRTCFPFGAFDAFVFVLSGKMYGADEEMYRLATQTGKPVCVARSFVDSLEVGDRERAEQDIRRKLSAVDSVKVLSFSNRTGEGVKAVYQAVISG